MSNSEIDPHGQPGIPIVSEETFRALESRYGTPGSGEQSWGERLTSMQEKLAATNPVLVHFFEMQVGKFPQELHNPMFEVLVSAMVILESQAEADAMNASHQGIDLEP